MAKTKVMPVAKKPAKSHPKNGFTSHVKGSAGKAPKVAASPTPTKKKPASRGRALPPVPDDPPDVDAIPGVPTKAEVDAVAAELSAEDRKAFAVLRMELARHLGSHAAARLWLSSATTGYVESPIELVKGGRVGEVLATQNDLWGPAAPYA